MPCAFRPGLAASDSSRSGWIRRRLFGAWTGLILLTLEILLGGALPLVPTASSAQGLDGDHLWVCTSAGMVEVGTDGAPLLPDGTDHQRLCVFCLPVLGGAVDTPPSVTAAPVRQAGTIGSPIRPTGTPAPAPAPLAGRSSPRAPPSA